VKSLSCLVTAASITSCAALQTVVEIRSRSAILSVRAFGQDCYNEYLDDHQTKAFLSFSHCLPSQASFRGNSVVSMIHSPSNNHMTRGADPIVRISSASPSTCSHLLSPFPKPIVRRSCNRSVPLWTDKNADLGIRS
jgi:hypothetical protein